ncbi:MAG: beta-galactosidase trimerization domain-containing protein [Clostridia bacterium]|nr:beta-galactosidase trimerization domain-containing protein [Clostridia bacterium]
MSKLPYRQIHLDFHTSECIEGIGSRFSKENFAAALKAGHVNSITLFSKCHHGWAYHPSEANQIHPHLDFDLLGAQLEVCRELGVRAEIYLSAGFDEKYAVTHQDHLQRDINGNCAPFDAPCYHRICFNTPYLDILCAQVEEVMVRYKGQFNGVFLDIIGAAPCWCEHCKAEMEKRGIDLQNRGQVYGYAKELYQHYCDRIDEAVHKHDPDMPIVHNDGGAIFRGRKVAFRNTKHLELESLPTGGWGYDHFPRAAAYARTLGKEFLGMTGKFHLSWGEFGGYKHPNALRYEAALSNACGAKCSVGDQLHPDGEMDLATYRLIGKAYAEVEAREPWMTDSEYIADIGLVSAEACINSPHSADFNCGEMAASKNMQDFGANRMLLEGHYLYNIVDPDEDFSKYKLLILPDNVTVDGGFKDKIAAYMANGGKLLLSGKSGVDKSGRFAIDFGAQFEGESEFRPNYLRPTYELYPNGLTSYVMYNKCYNVSLSDSFDGNVRILRNDSYFNRTREHFCSHRHTPYDRQKTDVGAIVTGNVGYIAWEIFSEYAEVGSIHLKYAVLDLIDCLLGDGKSATTSLPSQGIFAVMKQDTCNGTRLVNHIAYAVPKVRGKNVEIIEDIPVVLDTAVTVKCEKKPSRVYLAPSMEELDFTYADGKVSYTVPKFECSTLAVIEF